jgi:hypothetical protein
LRPIREPRAQAHIIQQQHTPSPLRPRLRAAARTPALADPRTGAAQRTADVKSAMHLRSEMRAHAPIDWTHERARARQPQEQKYAGVSGISRTRAQRIANVKSPQAP